MIWRGDSLRRDRAVTCTCRSGDGAADVQLERYGRGGAAVLLASVPLERVWYYTYIHKSCARGTIYVFIYFNHALVAISSRIQMRRCTFYHTRSHSAHAHLHTEYPAGTRAY